MKILVACEESQAVTKALRRLGHDAFSCDLLSSSGGHPEWHFNNDVFDVIANNGGALENGDFEPGSSSWDMMIAHPPCTYLAVSGARWMYHPDDSHLPTEARREHPRFPGRRVQQIEAIEFVRKLWDSSIPRVAIENPIGVLSTQWRKPDQIVHPYFFGDEASKATCLWLKGLPLLEPTDVVGKGEMVQLSSGRTLPKWYSDALTKSKTPEERRTMRSKTFQGLANAMAVQWTSE